MAALALAALVTGRVGATTVQVTGIVRDFLDSHPDFENGIASETGLVAPLLGGDDKPVYAGGAGTATTHGQAAFDQWYRNVSGVNLAAPLTLTLDNTITPDPGIYTYTSTSFFPIDNQLFGNQGRSHNYHFTFELHTQFTYGGGETFSFAGDDDLWVFINRRLAIDLGGVHGALSSSVNLDSLASTFGLTLGETYPLQLFFAERHTSQSNFRIDTSLLLEQPPPPGTIPEPGTCGLAVLACVLGILAPRRARRG